MPLSTNRTLKQIIIAIDFSIMIKHKNIAEKFKYHV